MGQCAKHGGECTSDAACLVDWSEINAKFAMMLRERDGAILQLSEARSATTDIEAKFHKATANVADLIGKLEQSNRLNRDLQQLFSEVATMFQLTTRRDIDGLLRARIQEALAGVIVSRIGRPRKTAGCSCGCHSSLNTCCDCGCA